MGPIQLIEIQVELIINFKVNKSSLLVLFDEGFMEMKNSRKHFHQPTKTINKESTYTHIMQFHKCSFK
jgi:hypothetical protein